MRCLVVVAVAYGCSGGGTDAGPQWVFTAIANAGIGNQALDLSAGAGMASTPSGVQVYGDDLGSCDHTFRFDVPAPLTVQAYALDGWTGSAFGIYTDCRFGSMNVVAGSGAFTVNRADSTCPQPPCIDAQFQFSAYLFAPQGFTAFFSGYVSNY